MPFDHFALWCRVPRRQQGGCFGANPETGALCCSQADRRRESDRLKVHEDRAQAALLVAVLAETRPDELREAYEDALARGPRWRAQIEALNGCARQHKNAAGRGHRRHF